MFLDLVKKRQSCRAYTDEPVSSADLNTLLEAALLAPSARNSQPWHYSVVLDKHHQDVANACAIRGLNEFAKAAPCLIVVSEDLSVKQRLVESSGRSFAEIDLGISVAHLCLCASELGLSTCIMGCFNEEPIKQALDLDSQYKVQLVVALGKAADPEIRPKKRKTMEEKIKRFE